MLVELLRIESAKTKKVIAACVSIVVIGWLMSIGLRSQSKIAVKEQKPEDVVLAMFNAMERGDVRTYLSLLDGKAKERVMLFLREVGWKEFGRQLRKMHEGIKGIAVLPDEPLSEDEVKLKVELVFEGKNETQFVRLKRYGRGWKVIEFTQPEHQPQLIPYGTPVKEL
ncbi:MAG: hypothetical protein RUDDFDWM_000447 [Candidatus Fervidibacterota bacterium]